MIDQEIIEQAEKKIQKVLMDWFTTDAILLNLYSMFNFVPDPNQETFGVNISGKSPVIIYNPHFVNAMPVEYLEMVMVHTGFKILLRHCTSRLKEPRQIAALSSNISVDELIYQNTLSVLKSDASLNDLIPMARSFQMKPKDCFETYFRDLSERQEQINKMITMIWNSMTEEDKQKLINPKPIQNNPQDKPKDQPENKQEESKEPPKQNQPIKEDEPKKEDKQEIDDILGEIENKNNEASSPEVPEVPEESEEPDLEEPKVKEQDEPKAEEPESKEPEVEKPEEDESGLKMDIDYEPIAPKEYKTYKNAAEGIKDYFDPNGSANIGWGTNDMFDADIKNYIDKNKDRVKAWGKHTGSAVEEIVAAQQPKISYKEVIRRFRKSVDTYARVNSRLKINRRYDMLYPGHRRFLKTRIIFAIDTSGSMSKEDLAEGFAVINKILKHAEVIFVMFDTEIKMVETKFKKAKENFKVFGRGGTDFNHVLQYADEIECDGIVIFTDGCAGVPKQPKAKVLWLTHSQDYKPPVTWGFRAYLDCFENAHTF